MKLILFTLLLFSVGANAQIALDEKELNTLVHKWNYANNARSEKTFLQLYADSLLFYTQRVSKHRSIRLKKALFSAYPDYRQRIISRIKFTPYTSGVIRADFVKEVIRDSVRKHYVSYLLLDYKAGKYTIAGESDAATDKTLQYVLRIGSPIELNAVNEDTTSAPMFNSAATSASTGTAKGFPDSLLEGEVTVSKKYIMILVGILAIGALLILFAPGKSGKDISTTSLKRDEGRNEPLEQLAFKRFVQSLFDPYYFVLKDLNPMSGLTERYHLMQVNFKEKDRGASFNILCVYAPTINDFVRISDGMKHDLQAMEEESYVVAGVRGSGENPAEIYLIPVNIFLSWTGDGAKLAQFKKWGMFFYRTDANRLV